MSTAGGLQPIEISDPELEVEGLRHVTANSRALGRRGDVTCWAPPGASSPLPLVVLLHGVYGSHWAWAHKGAAHRTAAALIEGGQLPPVAVAMPSDGLFGLGSGYVRHRGGDFAAWILDEVPALAEHALQGVDGSAPIAIVGLSMGGFGALLLGARHPGRVHSAVGLSSLTEFSQMRFFVGDISGYDIDEADRSVLSAVVAGRNTLPRMRIACGRSDPLLEANTALHEALDTEGIEHEWQLGEGGHEWPYWRAQLDPSLRFACSAV